MAERLLEAKGARHVLNHCTVNIGKINGGTKVNMVPDHAEAEVDIRIPLGVTTAMVEDAVDLIIREAGVEGVTYDLAGSQSLTVRHRMQKSLRQLLRMWRTYGRNL